MNKVRLVAIRFNIDFRKSELTNYNIHKRTLPPLGTNESYLFVSKSKNQLIWILNFGSAKTVSGTETEVIDSRRWRLTRGTWEPMMLADYAKAVNIELIGIKTFKEQYAEWKGKKKKK